MSQDRNLLQTLKYKWPVMGHGKQLAELEADIEQNRLSHAYLFIGPNKIGKALIARTFAGILQCPNHFCRDCPVCHQIEKKQHIDTLEIQDIGESLKIEEMRELLSHLSTTSSSRHKIVIFQNIERATPDAANAFLKHLEEPVPGVIFILTTAERRSLLDTILSRSRIIHFHPLAESTILEYLKTEHPHFDPKLLEMMAGFSMGKSGRAIDFFNDADLFRSYQEMHQQVLRFFEGLPLVDRMLYVENLIKTPESIPIFLELCATVARRILLKKVEGSQIPYSFEQLFDILTLLNRAEADLEHNVNARLVLENLVIHF